MIMNNIVMNNEKQNDDASKLKSDIHSIVMRYDENLIEVEYVSRILNNISISANLNGYHFLRDCIILKLNRPECNNKMLFSFIAEKYHTNINNINSGINHALKVAWDSEKIEYLNSAFSVNYFDLKNRKSNYQFICIVADLIKLKGMQ